MNVSAGKSFSPVSNRITRSRLPVVVFLFFTVLSGCSGAETVEITVGRKIFTVEIADTPEERATGLMNRRALPAESGMLFVFPRDQQVSFWMKNTTIPLTVAYIARDGTIIELHDLEPLSEIPVPSRRSVRFALELNRGAFKAAGVETGDQVAGLPH